MGFFTLYAQENYDFKEFKFPEIRFNALDVGFGLNSNYDNFRFNRRNGGRTSFFENRNDGFYSNFTNTKYTQALHSIRANTNVQFGKFISEFNDSTVLLEKSTFVGLITNLSGTQRAYLKRSEKQRFWEWNYTLLTSNSNLNQEGRFTSLYKENIFSIQAAVPIGIGRGRIEPISDVFVAWFLQKDLLDQGLMTKALSQEKLFELGAIMAGARNTRVLDFRRFRVQQLDRITQWFKENPESADVDNFSIYSAIADNAIYAFLNTRYAGVRKSLKLAPVLDFYQKNYTDDIVEDLTTRFTTYGALFFGDYLNAKPLSLKWQSDWYWQYGLYARSKPNGIIPELRSSQQDLYSFVQHSLGYYPNSRTSINLQSGIFVHYPILLDNTVRDPEAITLTPYLNLSGRYFLNYNLYIEGAVGTSYTHHFSDFTRSTSNDLGTFLFNPFEIRSSRSLLENQFNAQLYRRFGFNTSLRVVYSIF
jgi:hypothetical protein